MADRGGWVLQGEEPLRKMLEDLAARPTVIRPEGKAVLYKREDAGRLESVLRDWVAEKNNLNPDSIAIFRMPSSGGYTAASKEVLRQIGGGHNAVSRYFQAEMIIL